VEPAERSEAVAAALDVASSLGLDAQTALVLRESNRLAIRLLPCDVLARVAPAAQNVAQLELALASDLAALGAPVATLDSRAGTTVFARGEHVVTLWTYYETATVEIPSAEYAKTLIQLHRAMGKLNASAPHFTDRVESALQIATNRIRSPDLADDERELLVDVLSNSSRSISGTGQEQLLHGEPHPGNILSTPAGPLFIDFETACYGPVEFDVAHTPDEVASEYPGLDARILHESRQLALALATARRWDRDDKLPNGRRLGRQWLHQLANATSDAG